MEGENLVKAPKYKWLCGNLEFTSHVLESFNGARESSKQKFSLCY